MNRKHTSALLAVAKTGEKVVIKYFEGRRENSSEQVFVQLKNLECEGIPRFSAYETGDADYPPGYQATECDCAGGRLCLIDFGIARSRFVSRTQNSKKYSAAVRSLHRTGVLEVQRSLQKN